MEKTVVILAASALAATEAGKATAFPLSAAEAWQYAFVLVAAVFASLATENSKRRQDVPFYAPAFYGNVGLGVMAGLALPLLLGAIYEHFAHTGADFKASVGLSILGAYTGRDVLRGLWTLLLAIGTLVAKLKGLKVTFEPEPPPKGGDEDDR
ncbi:hypothetical protein [uncultured Deinococcus sp.]|uniref:hypothetical protein n=1 Tax=uncultured Deinococcus sp. TaxID=158789 RepID=UPI002600D05D|nr:hypothetical protein [uncultured Deinococcus sp.]